MPTVWRAGSYVPAVRQSLVMMSGLPAQLTQEGTSDDLLVQSSRGGLRSTQAIIGLRQCWPPRVGWR
jgi:hypothetical protein